MATKPKTRRGPQARGLVRRQQLEDAAEKLLESKDIDQISLADIAKEAGIPVASAYSFYTNVSDLFSNLLVKHTGLMFDAAVAPVEPAKSESWQMIVGQVIDGIADYLRSSRTVQQLRLSNKVMPEVRYTDERPRGADFALRLQDLISEAYVLPACVGGERPLVIMLDIAEAVLVGEYLRTDRVSEESVEEAKRAALAYLRLYVPEYLPRRESQPDGAEAGGDT
ncbi:TetR family transcriptional regulator [Shimia isoporae]|uniref:TetR family transcriptional regulator n=1 Tax=Shimia isoporae TaxID=647720 RepID=A0A4R1N733_9RHOB|nr:TetR/AcrR family transcriptional regulator [Shimia isoporae]TCL00597.1 TetR family transcriptional regulator [Shimia isoporae]